MIVAPHLVEVAFKGKRKEFFLWDGEDPPRVASPVIVEVDRGEDFGRVHAIGERAATRCGGCAHGCGTAAPERKVLRAATPEDERRASELTDEDEVARRKASERVKAHALVMKVSDAEWQWDRKKLTLYFTAEKRVDFRALVRDLAAAFRTRIELKQIGVRDEAKRLGGIGRCGREYCSASWLPELRPVNLQVAKDQHLSLNPSQISGACGRLMCCLRYEHDYYVQSRKRFPKEGRILVTSLGEEKVLANDIFGDRVTLRGPEGDTRVVPLAELKHELEQRASVVEEHEDETPVPEPTTETVLEDEAPVRSSASANAGAERTLTPLPGETPAAEATDRRPHRRRGRRGGRRGRPGGESPPAAPEGE
ncbi:MAG TPA: regulatory iron-sulfur-containing complex subunit RicT [Gemmatimonadaceae bacterium]